MAGGLFRNGRKVTDYVECSDSEVEMEHSDVENFTADEFVKNCYFFNSSETKSVIRVSAE